ncbi:hypothetical protein Poly24_06630 [Rosistilla carotiformis]|uniref:Uncharacterized protein n=1 Tax=Rosistilla carotiformis TaxID=2528017 RepID=A0A518JN47_9BACT|nr:hypothetical protein Poly24_06630 [Rosistilla carotiformis]
MSPTRKRSRARKQIAAELNVADFQDVTLDQLLAFTPRTETQSRIRGNAIANEGKRMLRERMGHVPRSAEKLAVISAEHEAESYFIERSLAYSRSYCNLDSSKCDSGDDAAGYPEECPFCGSTRLAGVGDANRDSLSCHDCGTTW